MFDIYEKIKYPWVDLYGINLYIYYIQLHMPVKVCKV